VTGDRTEVEAEGATVRDLLDDLEQRFPGIRARLYDGAGNLRRFVNLYVNDEDVRYLQGEQTPLSDGDELSIIPAIAGGAGSGQIRRATPPEAGRPVGCPAGAE
jgi:molybdopterin synthase sulfur carrier subunit